MHVNRIWPCGSSLWLRQFGHVSSSKSCWLEWEFNMSKDWAWSLYITADKISCSGTCDSRNAAPAIILLFQLLINLTNKFGLNLFPFPAQGWVYRKFQLKVLSYFLSAAQGRRESPPSVLVRNCGAGALNTRLRVGRPGGFHPLFKNSVLHFPQVYKGAKITFLSGGLWGSINPCTVFWEWKVPHE